MRSGAFSERPAASPTSLRWGVARGFVALKCAVAGVLVIGAVFFAQDRPALAAALVGAVVAGGYALRDLLVPIRLAADADGITVVSGYARRVRLDWSQIERIRLESRVRAGLRSEFLEIDTGDMLYLLSTYDLNARPADVADELARVRTSGGPG